MFIVASWGVLKYLVHYFYVAYNDIYNIKQFPCALGNVSHKCRYNRCKFILHYVDEASWQIILHQLLDMKLKLLIIVNTYWLLTVCHALYRYCSVKLHNPVTQEVLLLLLLLQKRKLRSVVIDQLSSKPHS